MLCLFDIDGTLLLKAADDHRDAIHAALRRVYHLDDTSAARVSTPGRTDPWIARAILLQLGVSAERIDDRMSAFKRVAAEEYRRRCRADLRDRVAPGVVDALGALRERPDVILSLVTGNLERIARLKLARAGLGDFFGGAHGGFGSDHEDRAELPTIARRRAGNAEGPYPRERTVVIGDTPHDIACARADGVRCIALATGPFAAGDLSGADTVLPSARTLTEAVSDLAIEHGAA